MKVKFVPQNIECEIKLGQSVLHVAQDNGIYIKSVCKGVPSCAECRVRVVDGDHNVLPPGTEELSLIGTGYFIDRRRLSCQLKCFGDITVDMTEQIAKEQGLIGGQKKKKLAIKDDRVEDVRAIRSSTKDEEDEVSESPLTESEDDSEEDSVDLEAETQAPQAGQGQGQGQGRRRRRRRRGGRGGQGGGQPQGGPPGGGQGGGNRGGRR